MRPPLASVAGPPPDDGPPVQQLAEALRRHGVEHAEVRWQERQERSLRWTPTEGPRLVERREAGWAVRVLEQGAWGFAAAPDDGGEVPLQTVRRALAAARTCASQQQGRTRLADQPVAVGRWPEPDAGVLTLEEPARWLAALLPLVEAVERLGGGACALRATERVDRVRLATTAGHALTQAWRASCWQLVGAGPEGWSRTACAAGDPRAGWSSRPLGERLARWQEDDGSAQVAAFAARLAELRRTTDDASPRGTLPLLLAPAALAQLVLATLVRPLELDRMLGLAGPSDGPSYLDPADLAGAEVFSPALSLTAVNDLSDLPGRRGWDDEGTAVRARSLIERGVLCGGLASRESAALVEELPGGGDARAASWRQPPVLRPGQLVLQPAAGGGSLEELIADTPHGLLLESCGGLAIDPLGATFRLVAPWGWEISAGRRSRLVRSPRLRGASHALWCGPFELGGPASLADLGLLGLDKGTPAGAELVGLRLPAVRFAGVEVLGG